MSGLEPSGPSQPTMQQAYNTSGNPAEVEPAERSAQGENAALYSSGEQTEQRVPREQSGGIQNATPSSLGRGVRGAPAGLEKQGYTQEQLDKGELDGDMQMRAPGEGEVADTVDAKPGASGTQVDLAGDLDRKKAEQDVYREGGEGRRDIGMDNNREAVEDVLRQRGNVS